MKLIMIIILLCGSRTMSAQENFPSSINIGLNLAPLATGTPELQGACFVYKFVGVTIAGGATFRILEGPIKLNDGVRNRSTNGVYWKAGLVGRLPLAIQKKKLSLWLKALYIGSKYEESAIRKAYISTPSGLSPNGTESVRASGIAHGFAISPGIDIFLTKHLDLRAGCQIGMYKRNDMIRHTAGTYQPGFGTMWGFAPEQFILGVNYRIGQVEKKSDKK